MCAAIRQTVILNYKKKNLILVDSIFFILQKRKQGSGLEMLSDVPEAIPITGDSVRLQSCSYQRNEIR